MSEQALTIRQQARDLSTFLEKSKHSFAQVLPKHLTPDRMCKVALTAALKTPKLLQCSRESLFQSLIEASELGLEPGGAQGHGYLVPYKTTCTFIPGYRGLVELAIRSGKVHKVYAHPSYENDFFDYELGTSPGLKHKPRIGGDRGSLVCVYAVAKAMPGDPEPWIEVMSREEVEEIRNAVYKWQDGPWGKHFSEMARKTVLRRLCKQLPTSPELARALELSDRADGVEVPFESGQVIEFPTAAGAAKATDDLAAKLKNKVEPVVEREPGEEG